MLVGVVPGGEIKQFCALAVAVASAAATEVAVALAEIAVAVTCALAVAVAAVAAVAASLSATTRWYCQIPTLARITTITATVTLVHICWRRRRRCRTINR